MTEISDRTETLFAAAVELQPEDRQAFLNHECADNQDLRNRLEALLQAHDRASHLLDHAPLDAPEQTVLQPGPSEVGTVIAGRYKLLEQIGEGGMGAVWVAEQLEPVRRKVALKLVKPGMDSRSVLARFEAERQALALMDHPNIAKVLDGGLTDSGRPYFVMEYVKGVPITEYCDAARLNLSERLALFLQVCSAVQHAHQKGIIHRDLKPSNVLVAPYDDKPVPKVIDFGLAKALNQSLTDKTLHTAHETVLGTPLYMSPEQAQLNNLDVDTRTDIYALGVLLYELLTGTTPFEKESFKTAAWDEVRRIIREVDPPRPSLRLSSAQTLPSLAANRHTEPLKLTQQVRGDLDWIVMKALEKDRTRRYETATSLSRDIERHLAEEIIEARPPSTSYRLRKFIRRNRGQVIAAGLLLATLLIGIAGTTYGLIRAERERQHALQERQVALQERQKAVEQKDIAHRKEKEAADAAEEADHERTNATIALAAEKTARENLARLDYARSIQLAYQYWLDDNVGETVRLMDQTSPEFRGWEWHYLHRLCHSDVLTLNVSKAPVSDADYNRDGSKIVTADDEGQVTIWDPASGARIRTFAHGDMAFDASFNHNSSRVLSVHFSFNGEGPRLREAVVWDVRTREHFTFGGTQTSGAEYSHDGTRIVTTHYDRTVRVWDAVTGKELPLLEEHSGKFTSERGYNRAVFSSDDSRIFATPFNSREGTGAITIWDVETGKIVLDTVIADGMASSARLSEDGRQIIVPLRGGGANRLDATTGNVIETLDGRSAPIIYSVEFSPDGQRIISHDYSEVVTIRDLETGKILNRLKGHTNSVRVARFSPDGNLVLTGSRDGTVKIWDPEASYQSLVLPQTETGAGFSCFHFSPDSNSIATATGGVVKIWNVNTGSVVDELDLHQGPIRSLRYFRDGNRILIHNSKLTVWNKLTGEQSDIPADIKNIRAFELSPDEQWIVATNSDGSVDILDAETGKVRHFLDQTNYIWASFSPDSTRIVTTSHALDRRVRVWDVKTGNELATFTGHVEGDQHYPVFHAAFSPDGTKVTSIGNRKTYIWDPATGREILTLNGITDGQSFDYSPNGKRIITDSNTGVSIWDAETGHLLLDLKTTSEKSIGGLYGLSPDGTCLAIGTTAGLEIFDSRPFPHTHTVNP